MQRAQRLPARGAGGAWPGRGADPGDLEGSPRALWLAWGPHLLVCLLSPSTHLEHWLDSRGAPVQLGKFCCQA